VNSNAPGQLLGYTLQYPRALCHLLRADPGSIVCIEVLGDVATVSSADQVLAEEDKSSVTRNPVTDRSVDLWKTFSNWVDDVNSGKLTLSSTRFILFRNQCGKKAIVDDFDSAKNQEEATAALDRAKQKLNDLGSEHVAWNFYNNAVLKNPDVLIQIIERFQLETRKGTGYEDVKLEVTKKHVPKTQIDFIVQNLNGWLVKLISERIAAKQLAEITWEEFDYQFKVLFDRARRRELIDFALINPPNSKVVQDYVSMRPKYLRQLELINSSDDELIEAVTDYLRAKINRSKWIDDEIIDESVANDFEKKLEGFWKNARTGVELKNKQLSEEDRGKLLLSECKSRQETIRDMNPPNSTIAGTYHALADVPSIGWHPSWKKLSETWS
jgi:hypothetical protein